MVNNQPLHNYVPNIHRIVAYFTNWSTYKNYNPRKSIKPNTLTHLNYAFAKIVETGKGNYYCIEPTDNWADLEKPIGTNKGLYDFFNNKNNEFRTQNKNIKVLISIGGWTGSKYFSKIAQDHNSREHFAKCVVDFVTKYGFDGADLDWEFPVEGGEKENYRSPKDKQNFTLLLKAIKQEFGKVKQKTLLLTVALSAVPLYMKNIELNSVARTVDWINVMTYDFSGPWSSKCTHHSNLHHDSKSDDSQLSIDKAVNHMLSEKVAANKIVVGVGFYGRGFTDLEIKNIEYPLPQNFGNNVQYGSLPQGKHEKGVFHYYEIKPILEKCVPGHIKPESKTEENWHKIFDPKLKTVHLINTKSKTFITFDDPQSIAWKIYYIRTKGLGGMMIWELSGDHKNELTDAIVHEFNRK